MGNQVGDVTTKSAMSQKRLMWRCHKNVKTKKNVCATFELVMKYSTWLCGPFLGYNTKSVARQHLQTFMPLRTNIVRKTRFAETCTNDSPI